MESQLSASVATEVWASISSTSTTGSGRTGCQPQSEVLTLSEVTLCDFHCTQTSELNQRPQKIREGGVGKQALVRERKADFRETLWKT